MPFYDFETAALVTGADASANPGGPGLTTSAKTNLSALTAANEDAFVGTVVAPGMAGTAGGHVVPWWLALIVAVVIWKFFEEKGSGTYGEIKIGIGNILKISILAIIGMTFLKWVFGLYVVPGLSAIVEAA